MPRTDMMAGRELPVQDEHGRNMYFIGGQLAGLAGRLWIRDRGGRELAFVRESRSLEGLPVGFEIHYADELHSVVKRDKVSTGRCRFPHDNPAPDDLQAYGDLPNHEYAFSRDDLTAATVTRHWFHSADVYSIDVARGEDEVLILAAAMVVDLSVRGELAVLPVVQPEVNTAVPKRRTKSPAQPGSLFPGRGARISSAH